MAAAAASRKIALFGVVVVCTSHWAVADVRERGYVACVILL